MYAKIANKLLCIVHTNENTGKYSRVPTVFNSKMQMCITHIPIKYVGARFFR